MLVEISDVTVTGGQPDAKAHWTFATAIFSATGIGAAAIWLLAHPFSASAFRGLALAAATGTVLFFAQLSLVGFRCVRTSGRIKPTRQITA
jgi:hypothetical protein